MSASAADNQALDLILRRLDGLDDLKTQVADMKTELTTEIAVVKTEVKHIRASMDKTVETLQEHSAYVAAHKVESKADSLALEKTAAAVRKLEDSALESRTRRLAFGTFAGALGAALLQMAIQSYEKLWAK